MSVRGYRGCIRAWGIGWRALVPLLMGLAGGCVLPAQLHWSADGTKAIYVSSAAGEHVPQMALINDQGAVLKELGKSQGGVAWSADSKSVYFATVEQQRPHPGPDNFELHDQEANIPTPPAATAPATARDNDVQNAEMVVKVLRDDTISELFYLKARIAWHMALSPDGKWLAVAAGESLDRVDVYVYFIPGKKLYALSHSAGLAMAFTGPRRLAFTVSDRLAKKMDDVTGVVKEVVLEETGERSDHSLFTVLPGDTPWLAPLGEDVLFTTRSATFPGKVETDQDEFKLYRYTRADRNLTPIAEEVGPLFMPSPNGKRILFVKMKRHADGKGKDFELSLMNANGSDPHMLRKLDGNGALPMWPIWHGNDEIAFVAPPSASAKPDESGFTACDVVLYRINAKVELEPVRTLSAQWPQALKPLYKP